MKPDGKENIPCYVGRDTCGCILSAIVDDKDDPCRKLMLKEIKKFMRECINTGLTLDRSTVGVVRETFGHKCGKQ
jgi:hypothetical protein